MEKTIDELIDNAVQTLESHGVQIVKREFRIKIPSAKERFEKAIKKAIGQDAQWLGEYDEIVDWLTDNGGKGLMLIGRCGTGKSVVACRVLPIVFNTMSGRIYRSHTAKEFSRLQNVPENDIVIIDDIGTEGNVKEYGTDRDNIGDVIDRLDFKGGLGVITTNLDADAIRAKYGDRTYDRIRTNFKFVYFLNKSLRQ